ncbi:acylphosphatase [Candidatus Woesearchaeota archaeon]|nr:acylphosphatase [Candidatus Woesearchaeota archaeon]
MKRVHLIVKGRVQGVGYRAKTRRLASQFDIKGYVKNLPDGRVEVVAEGNDKNIDKFVLECKRGSFVARVDEVKESYSEPTNEFDEFEIEF